MASKGKRSRDDATDADIDSFFGEIAKGEEQMAKKQKVANPKEIDIDMSSFFGEVSKSEASVKTQQQPEKKKSVAASSSSASTASASASTSASAPVAAAAPPPPPLTKPPPPPPRAPALAAHHAPLDFDEDDAYDNAPQASSTYNATMMMYAPAQPQAAAAVPAPPPAASSSSSSTNAVSRVPVRVAAGKQWRDKSLLEWPDNDYRLFIGNLDRETKLEQLEQAFAHYPSFAKAKLVLSTQSEKGRPVLKCKGFGFASFLDPMECAKALRTENGKYCGLRPMQIKKSSWQDRNKNGGNGNGNGHK
jgi:hypothetical protein